MNQSIDEHPTFLIWDSEGEPPKGKWILILWQSYSEGANLVYSIPRLVEEQADALRERYLAWIYDLGEAHIKGKRLVDHLELHPGFSYWWMTLIAEKCNAYKSFQIVDALKLLALEELIVTHSASTIILVSGNKTLVKTFMLWCKNAGLVFEWRSLKGRKAPDSWIRKLYLSLPYPVQAFISLARYIWQRWPLKQQNVAGSGEITFVDYLIHLNQKALTTGRFASNFWTDLIAVLDSAGSKVNWLHHYIQHEAVTSTRQAQDLIDHFNQSGGGRQFHTYLDGELCISVVLAALIDYSRLIRMTSRVNTIKCQFSPNSLMLDFWPLFKRDWYNSMLGPVAILNCLVLNMFERTLRRLPHQKLGVYLQENQGWEMAFIHAWRSAGHGQLIGVPHSTVRYWDLRYLFDPRNYSRTGKNELPVPDKVALNGPAAVKAYQEGGYPENQMVEVESLRYMYLASQSLTQGEFKGNTDVLRVLVLGDYSPAVTHQQMQWIEAAAQDLLANSRYTVKSHPSCAIKSSDYPSLQLHMTNAPLAELLADSDVVFTSNITSAAVDAYFAGVSVVSVLGGDSLNMSPLRGLEGVVYVTSPAELADALRDARYNARVVPEPYFCLDKGLPRWRYLLELVD